MQINPSTEGFYTNKSKGKKSMKINSRKSSRCNLTVSEDKIPPLDQFKLNFPQRCKRKFKFFFSKHPPKQSI